MSIQEIHHLRTNPKTEREVVKQIALGNKYADISVKTGVPVSTIKKIRKRNDLALKQIKQHIIQSDAHIAVRMRQKSLRELENRLDNASDQITTKDLVSIIKEMSNQALLDRQESASEQLTTDESPEFKEALRLALKRGDPVELQRLIFHKN